jgi:glycerophosphoryl diester phosphodiesterase
VCAAFAFASKFTIIERPPQANPNLLAIFMLKLFKLLVLTTAAILSGCTTVIDVQGHRGARGLMPENTIPAFARALELGVSTLELDVGITHDGVVVVHHDIHLNPDIARNAAGEWLANRPSSISSLSYAQLQTYDVGRLKLGTPYQKRYPEQQALDDIKIPRLVDVLELVKKSGNNTITISIETKISPLTPEATLPPEVFVDAVLKVLTDTGMSSRVILQSFDWRTLRYAQKVAPYLPTVYLSAQQKFLDNIADSDAKPSLWTAGFSLEKYKTVPAMVQAAGGWIWSPYYGDVTAETISEAKALGLKVVVWTVNEPKQIEKMLDLRVDGIISDRPDIVLKMVKARGLRVK